MTTRPLLLSLCLLLGACSILPRADAPDVYLLPSHADAPARAGAAVNWSLRVDTPQASNALDSNRIAVVPSDNIITVYQGARWSDPAPVLVRNRLLDALRATARITALSSDEESLQADFVLDGGLRAFQTEYDHGQPVVVIRYDAWLVRDHSQRILATAHFQVRQPSAGPQIAQVVAAFGQASDELAGQVSQWAMQAIAAAPSVAAPH